MNQNAANIRKSVSRERGEKVNQKARINIHADVLCAVSFWNGYLKKMLKRKEYKMRVATEAQIQRGVLDYLELLSRKKPIYYFRSAAGMVKTDQGRVFKTGKPGTPDITVCFDGLFIGLEIKTTTGRQSALQKKAQAEIEAAGGKYYIIRCLEDIWKILS